MKTGFFYSIYGRKSSTRLLAFIIVIYALVLAQQVVYFGRENVIVAAAAAGTLFLTIAGPTLAWVYAQKKTEVNEGGKNETAN